MPFETSAGQTEPNACDATHKPCIFEGDLSKRRGSVVVVRCRPSISFWRHQQDFLTFLSLCPPWHLNLTWQNIQRYRRPSTTLFFFSFLSLSSPPIQQPSTRRQQGDRRNPRHIDLG
ncbi:hypothetical protein IF2G_01351 [Cordyceps javanica]|nr:hypothetical protein IF2G_01351 [Cordyceps javanica]